MDDVHDDGQAHAVRLVHQRLQFLRRAEAGAGGEEVGDVVTEAAVVRVLHDAHQLERVVAGLLDAGENLFRELGVGADAFGLLRHAHVRLVNQGRLLGVTAEVILPDVGLGGPDLRGEETALGVLHGAADVGGDTFPATALPADFQVVELSMLHRIGGAAPLEDVAPRDALGTVSQLAFPVVEVSDQPDFGGVGGPFTEDPAIFGAVETVILMGAGEVCQRLPSRGPAGETGREGPRPFGAVFNHVRVGREPRIVQQAGSGGGHVTSPGDRGSARSHRRRAR